jgi:hypothetical protein
MVYSSMVHVAGGEGGSIRHDGEMPSPAPRVDLAQSTAVKSLDRQARRRPLRDVAQLLGVDERPTPRRVIPPMGRLLVAVFNYPAGLGWMVLRNLTILIVNLWHLWAQPRTGRDPARGWTVHTQRKAATAPGEKAVDFYCRDWLNHCARLPPLGTANWAQ